jgi:hypothetical protein
MALGTGVRLSTTGSRAGRVAAASADNNLYWVGGIGQSNMLGGGGGLVPTYTTVAVGPNILMFNGGVTPGGSGSASNFTSLTPLLYAASANNSVPGCWGFGHRFNELTSGKRLLFSISATNATALSAQMQGSSAYNALLYHVTRAKALAEAAGLTLVPLGIVCMGGETDQTNGGNSFDATLTTVQSTYQTDINAITGRADTIPIYTDQQSHYTPASALSVANSTANMAWLAHKANPSLIRLLGGRYMEPGDGDGSSIHVSNYGLQRQGARFAEFVYRDKFLAEDVRPVAPIPGQVTIAANVITVNCTAHSGSSSAGRPPRSARSPGSCSLAGSGRPATRAPCGARPGRTSGTRMPGWRRTARRPTTG